MSPRREVIKVPEPQRMIQPINHMKVGYGYMNKKYVQQRIVVFRDGTAGKHFGADYWSADGDLTIWPSCNGIVVATSRGLKNDEDSTFGQSVVVLYPNVYNHRTKRFQSVAAAYFHMSKILVEPKQPVTTAVRLGIMGTTGLHSSGVHLHFQLDANVGDPLALPCINRTTMFHPAKRHTHLDPADFLHTKVTPPDSQTVVSAGEWWQGGGKRADWTFPIVR